MSRQQTAIRRWLGGGLAALPLVAAAQSFEPLARIESVAVAAVTAQLPASATVAGGSLDPRLRLARCDASPTAEPPALRGANASVTVRCASPQWTVYVPLRISDLRPVLVLARPVQRGETLSADALTAQTRDVAQLPFGYVEQTEAAVGQQLRRALAAGAVLGPNDLEAPRLVRRGEAVTVLSRAGGIEVRAGGTALADAARGERVRVRNDSSKRTVEGVVTAPGVVEIRS